MVEWKKLGEISTVQRGKRLTKNLLSDNEVYPVYHGGIEPLGYFKDFNRLENTVMVINVGASAGSVGFSNQKFWSSDGCFCISHNIFINNKYLYFFLLGKEHYLRSQVRYAGIPTLDSTAIGKIPIPIPPLSEQNRIVGILDTFTESIENLKKQITERKKQYEHYRDQLLDLEGKPGVEMKILGDIGDVTKLAGFEFTEHVVYKEKGEIIALRGLNVRDGHLDLNQVKFIDDSNFAKLNRSKLIINDMLFTYVGTIGNVALIDKNDKYYLAPNVSRIRFKTDIIIPKYALYVFLSYDFYRTQIEKYLNASSMRNLSMENIRKFRIPIPSIDEQKRIVSILDHPRHL